MKILVLGLDGLPGDRLLGDNRLVHVRLLMESGCFGHLSGDLPEQAEAFWRTLECGRHTGKDRPVRSSETLPGLLADEGSTTILITSGQSGDDPTASSRSAWDELLRRMASEPWSFARLVDDTPGRLLSTAGEAALDARIARFDDELPTLLDCLGEESIVLLIARDPTSAAFVLATSTGVAPGEVQDLRLDDLAPVLLAIAHRPIPPSMTGRPPDGLSPSGTEQDSDEQSVIDRLRGLGYL